MSTVAVTDTEPQRSVNRVSRPRAAIRRISHNRTLRRLLRKRAAAVALCFVVLLVAVAVLAPVIMPHDPGRQSLLDRYEGPSSEHWLGSDSLGRDNLSRLIEGTRVTLWAALQAIVVAVVLGIPAGLLAGYVGRMVDAVLNRIADVLLALPPLILALSIVGILGPGLSNAMLAIGVVMAPRFFRVARAAAASVRNETYIEATRAMGCSSTRILFRHVLPNSSGPLLVQVSFALGVVVTSEASLSFLGLGAVPPTASWGTMVRDAFSNVYDARSQLIAPSIMVVLTILAFSVLGDGLRDALGRGSRGTRISKSDLASGPSRAERVLMQSRTVSPTAPLLEVENLAVDFFTPHGPVRVVEGVSFTLADGETFGLVGESGSGKTVTSLALLGMISLPTGRVADGSVRLRGRELVGLPGRDLRPIRGGEVSMIFQEPRRSLDPAFTVGDQIAETVRAHLGVSRRDAWRRAVEMLELVKIPDAKQRAHQYPHQFSGGMAQRVMLAIALSCSPKVLIADEPTTALDVTVQAQVLELIRELQADLGLAVLFISHDLGVIAQMCDRVGVMYAGQLVEQATAFDLFARPRHPYTAALLASIANPEAESGRLVAIPGAVPPAHAWPTGCRFHPRCAHVTDRCVSEAPQPVTIAGRADAMARCLAVESLHLERVR
jgi:peptide/nickel transport system permease protein